MFRGALTAGGVLLISSIALAHGRPVGTTAAYSYPAYYSYPPTVFYLSPYVPPCPWPVVVPGFAQPTPAPPSQRPAFQSIEPPLAGSKSAPTVTESRSRAKKTASVSEACCQVGFWNVSGQDVTLIVDGQSRLLPNNRALTLLLGRQFTWRVAGRTSRSAQVPAGRTTLEIVVRK
jgi:hypothetical protein